MGMMKSDRNVRCRIFAIVIVTLVAAMPVSAFETETFETDRGAVEVTFIGHGSMMFRFGGMVVHVDPWSEVADYSELPDADVLLLTHYHSDHLDRKALDEVLRDDTRIYCPSSCTDKLGDCDTTVMSYGDETDIGGVHVETLPAYNLTNLRNPGGRLVHPKGIGNGYIVSFGGLRFYHASETEFVPELKAVHDIDVMFLAVDSVYNMTPVMAAEFVFAVRPEIFYPIHYADADMKELAALLKSGNIQMRLRSMK